MHGLIVQREIEGWSRGDICCRASYRIHTAHGGLATRNYINKAQKTDGNHQKHRKTYQLDVDVGGLVRPRCNPNINTKNKQPICSACTPGMTYTFNLHARGQCSQAEGCTCVSVPGGYHRIALERRDIDSKLQHSTGHAKTAGTLQKPRNTKFREQYYQTH
jgi:hypothetical protein